MNRYLPRRRLALVLVLAVLSTAASCPKAPPNLTPAAVSAFYGTRVIQTLDVIRDLAVSANKQTPPLVSTPHMVTAVTWHRAAITVVHTAPAGWKATVHTGLDETLKTFAPAERQLFAPYVALIHAVLAEKE